MHAPCIRFSSRPKTQDPRPKTSLLTLTAIASLGIGIGIITGSIATSVLIDQLHQAELGTPTPAELHPRTNPHPRNDPQAETPINPESEIPTYKHERQQA